MPCQVNSTRRSARAPRRIYGAQRALRAVGVLDFLSTRTETRGSIRTLLSLRSALRARLLACLTVYSLVTTSPCWQFLFFSSVVFICPGNEGAGAPPGRGNVPVTRGEILRVSRSIISKWKSIHVAWGMYTYMECNVLYLFLMEAPLSPYEYPSSQQHISLLICQYGICFREQGLEWIKLFLVFDKCSMLARIYFVFSFVYMQSVHKQSALRFEYFQYIYNIWMFKYLTSIWNIQIVEL